MQGKCFICAKLTERGEILNQNESSIVLHEILGLPKSHAIRSILERFQKVCYCPECLKRVQNIQLWTTTQDQELEENLMKERKILWKDLLRNCTQVKTNSDQPPLGMLQLLRNEIVAQIRESDRSRELDELMENQGVLEKQIHFNSDGDNLTSELFAQKTKADDEYENQSKNKKKKFKKKSSSTKRHLDDVSNLNLRNEDEIEQCPCPSDLPSCALSVDHPKEESFTRSSVKKKTNLQEDKVLKCKPRSCKCQVCDKVYPDRIAWKIHTWSIHRKDGEFVCLECDFTSKYLSKLVTHHVRHHSQQRNFKCDECEASFKSPYVLSSHKKIHSFSGIYKCKLCSAQFSRLGQLNRHEGLGHSKTKSAQQKGHYEITSSDPDSSDLEEECFAPSNIVKKIRIKTDKVLKSKSVKSKLFKCNGCGTGHSSPKALKIHISSIHLKDGRYICLECDFTSISMFRVGRHYARLHSSNQKNFKCDECEASFKGAFDLSKHKEIHSRSGLYKCKWCSAEFNYFPQVKRHEGLGHPNKKHVEPK